MTLLILGLLIWSLAHLWKRILPGTRAEFGETGKAIVGILSVVAILLMIVGYKEWDGTVFWGRTTPMTYLNNLLMVVAFYLFAASGSKARITKYIRHPQLTGLIVFAVAHLLVNGDTPSFVLFGGLIIWAHVEIYAINSADGPRGPYHAVPIRKEISAIVGTFVILAVVGAIHALLGYNPFG